MGFITVIYRSSTARWIVIAVATSLFGIGLYVKWKRKYGGTHRIQSSGSHQSNINSENRWFSLKSLSNCSVGLNDQTSVQLFQTGNGQTAVQLYQTGNEHFQNAINCWKESLDLICLTKSEITIPSDPDVVEFGSSTTSISSSVEGDSIRGATPKRQSNRLNERLLRTLLTHSDVISYLILAATHNKTDNGHVPTLRLDDNIITPHTSQTSLSSTYAPGSIRNDDYDDDDDNNVTLDMDSQSSGDESFASATVLSDTGSINNHIPARSKTHSLHSSVNIQSPLTSYITTLPISVYKLALNFAKTGKIPYRQLRTQMLCCYNDDDYLAKLYCVRLAFDELLKTESNQNYFQTQTLELMSKFLVKAGKDAEPFCKTFSEMINFVKNPQNSEIINEELNERGLPVIGFFDVAIDFALLDAFVDLENIPSALSSVTQNTWLTAQLRESAVTNAVWGIMMGKIKLLKYKNGFMYRFYRLGETFMLTLAWGFLGTDEGLKKRCLLFKNEILNYLKIIFNSNSTNYDSIQTLSSDILRIGKTTIEPLGEKL